MMSKRGLFKGLEKSRPSKKPKKETATAGRYDDTKPRTSLVAEAAMAHSSSGGTTHFRFAVLAKIVNHLRSRHLSGQSDPLTIDEILDQTFQLNIEQSLKTWLLDEALVNNPKISVTPFGTRFAFKPVYKIKNGKGLLRLLKYNDLKGLGGVQLDDVKDSLPNFDKVLKKHESEITIVTRPLDKKRILFFKDASAKLEVDEEFKKLWNSVRIDAISEEKIVEYLEKDGMRPMKGPDRVKEMRVRKKVGRKKNSVQKFKDNEHLTDILETYESKEEDKKK